MIKENLINSAFLYNIATMGYCIALFTYILNLPFKKELWRRASTILVALSFLAQTFGMILRWAEAGRVEVAAYERGSGELLSGVQWWWIYTQHPPWSNLYEILVYMSWGIILVFLVTEVRFRIRFIGIFALLLALATLGLASLTDGSIKPLVPALKSWWIMVHVISASIAYASGTIGAIASFLYLIKAKERITLTRIASGTLFLSAFLLFLLGRGSQLWLTGEYKVKLLRVMGDEQITVGRFLGDKFVPYYVSSPFVGAGMLVAFFCCLVAGIGLWRSRNSQAPQGAVQWLFRAAVLVTCVVFGGLLLNDVKGVYGSIPADIVGSLVPPMPWQIGLRSHTWDVGLFGLLVAIQLVVLLCCQYPNFIRSRLPSEGQLDRVAYGTVMVAFALVAVVLVTGALWAHYAWGRYWAWDPKETGALVIWLTYALYLHTRATYGWAGVRSAVIGIVGFFIILAGFLGVNLGFFAEGLHSYGSS